ncbi:MAG: GrdX family protein [Filifactor alocis]|nr:GrdX family protein [Filifactor alocis]
MLITNNELFRDKDIEQVIIKGSAFDVLLETRDHIHRGYRLLSSPISASIRMIMSPVRTVVLSSSPGALDEYSLNQIEAAIEKHGLITENRGEDISNLSDYAILDHELTMSAISEVDKNFWR